MNNRQCFSQAVTLSADIRRINLFSKRGPVLSCLFLGVFWISPDGLYSSKEGLYIHITLHSVVTLSFHAESLKLEKTIKIISSNCQPTPTMPCCGSASAVPDSKTKQFGSSALGLLSSTHLLNLPRRNNRLFFSSLQQLSTLKR